MHCSQPEQKTIQKILQMQKPKFYKNIPVGHGSFGIVYKAEWRGQEKSVAVKKTRPNFLNEFEKLSRCKHKNIIEVYGVYEDPPYMCLVMEYAVGGSLHNLLHCSEIIYYTSHAMSWARQCAEGVAYLHAMRPKPLLHRDLKPLNLLLFDEGRILKLCDFATVRNKSTIMSDNIGTPAWMAPEVFNSDGGYTEKCDVYSWGIILWEIISRQQPFNNIASSYRLQMCVCNGERPPLKVITGVSKKIKNLMTKCWDPRPKQRPSMKKVVEKMRIFCQSFSNADQALDFSMEEDKRPPPRTETVDSNRPDRLNDSTQPSNSKNGEFSGNYHKRNGTIFSSKVSLTPTRQFKQLVPYKVDSEDSNDDEPVAVFVQKAQCRVLELSPQQAQSRVLEWSPDRAQLAACMKTKSQPLEQPERSRSVHDETDSDDEGNVTSGDGKVQRQQPERKTRKRASEDSSEDEFYTNAPAAKRNAFPVDEPDRVLVSPVYSDYISDEEIDFDNVFEETHDQIANSANGIENTDLSASIGGTAPINLLRELDSMRASETQEQCSHTECVKMFKQINDKINDIITRISVMERYNSERKSNPRPSEPENFASLSTDVANCESLSTAELFMVSNRLPASSADDLNSFERNLKDTTFFKAAKNQIEIALRYKNTSQSATVKTVKVALDLLMDRWLLSEYTWSVEPKSGKKKRPFKDLVSILKLLFETTKKVHPNYIKKTFKNDMVHKVLKSAYEIPKKLKVGNGSNETSIKERVAIENQSNQECTEVGLSTIVYSINNRDQNETNIEEYTAGNDQLNQAFTDTGEARIVYGSNDGNQIQNVDVAGGLNQKNSNVVYRVRSCDSGQYGISSCSCV